ncbi:hypothetical protein [Pedobacter agri]|uniref:hypothetical protein n=1 Tax=Pedobacter agri TaxID=454586 RepID=UPI0029306E98|nr:hypothetical protein [Pedobacter agri]
MIQKLLKFSGVDDAILWSILNKILSVVKGPISLYFLIRYLSPTTQGLWFTFGSLGALTIFAELGFLTIITQFVSHEFAYLEILNGKISGEPSKIDRLFALIRFSVKFYSIIVPAAIFILCVVGFFFFSAESANVKEAWYVFSIVGGASLILSLLQSIYTGLNNVKQAQINAFLCTFLGAIANWVMLILKFSIWALVWGNLFGILIAAVVLYYSAPSFWNQLLNYKVYQKYNFLKETLPLQGKYAISWISAFFILYLLVPAAYRFASKIEAGQVGMTVALISAATGVSNAWIITKVPLVNILVAQKKYAELDAIFVKSFIQSVIIQLILFVFLIAGMKLLNIYQPKYVERFLDIKNTILLMLPQFTQLSVIFISVYLRAHKEEPLMWITLIQSILILISVIFIFRLLDLQAFLLSLNIIYLAFVLPFSYYIFRKKVTQYKTVTHL